MGSRSRIRRDGSPRRRPSHGRRAATPITGPRHEDQVHDPNVKDHCSSPWRRSPSPARRLTHGWLPSSPSRTRDAIRHAIEPTTIDGAPGQMCDRPRRVAAGGRGISSGCTHPATSRRDPVRTTTTPGSSTVLDDRATRSGERDRRIAVDLAKGVSVQLIDTEAQRRRAAPAALLPFRLIRDQRSGCSFSIFVPQQHVNICMFGILAGSP